MVVSRCVWLPIAAVALLSSCSVANRFLARGGGGSTSSSVSTRAPAPLPDDGLTNETHRRFVGQIVFAPKQIDRTQPDETGFVSEFYADEIIYGRAYLPHSITNALVTSVGSSAPTRNTGRGYEVRLVVDGVRQSSILEHGTVRSDRSGHTTAQVWPHPAASDESTSTVWKKLVDELTPGAHEVTVELWARDGSFEGTAPIAAGTITLHKIADMRVGIGETFADLKAGMTDPALERELLAVITEHAKRERWKERLPGLTIESSEWGKVFRKTTRVVVAQRLVGWVHLAGANDECGAQRIVFEQPVSVMGKRGSLFVREVGARVTLDCTRQDAPRDRWAGRARKQPAPTTTAATAVASPSPSPSPASVPAPSPSAPPARVAATEPSVAAAPDRAAVAASSDASLQATSVRPSRAAQRVSLGLGMATNAADPTGVASYANIGLHLGRIELGAGATWPLNALGYLRVAAIAGRFELAPMVSVSALAESGMTTSLAVSGGLSFAYALWTGSIRAGLRLDALVSYNPAPGELALPVLGSTYVRF